MTDLLDRNTLVYWNRNGLQPMKTPNIAHDGPKVMLINAYSSSEAMPSYFFKRWALANSSGHAHGAAS